MKNGRAGGPWRDDGGKIVQEQMMEHHRDVQEGSGSCMVRKR